MFKKILIANRGEIACRIARTCHRLGIAAAGVHSRADANALHVKTIGESIEIGGAPAAESYLRIDAVIAAARATGAQAIHPGFGFLAENAAFARAVEAAGLIFIGPTPETIERLGDKALAKHEAAAAGVPTVPGSSTASEDAGEIATTARNIGLPVMLKAAAGGGGSGMRAVADADSLDAEISSAMREAKSSFGSAGLIVEKLVERGRHIEVQIAGDGQGNVIHLFERECSLQRRHQKLIEEAPAANLPAAMRKKMLADAVRLGQRLNYRGVGTVEFIVTGDAYYFLEVNPRLQVEHPVTEMVTGLDIVEMMLRIASRQRPCRWTGPDPCAGHAIEVRICAEDAANNFLPSTGTLAYVQLSRRVGAGRSWRRNRLGSHAILQLDDRETDCSWRHARDCPRSPGRRARRDVDLRRDHQSGFPSATPRPARHARRNVPHAADRRTPRCARWIGAEAAGRNARHRGLSLDDASAPGVLRQSLAMARDDRLAHGQRQRRALPVPLLHLEARGTNAEIRFAPQRADGTMLDRNRR